MSIETISTIIKILCYRLLYYFEVVSMAWPLWMYYRVIHLTTNRTIEKKFEKNIYQNIENVQIILQLKKL